MDFRNKTVGATFFHAPKCGVVEVLSAALVGIGVDGRITRVLNQSCQQ